MSPCTHHRRRRMGFQPASPSLGDRDSISSSRSRATTTHLSPRTRCRQDPAVPNALHSAAASERHESHRPVVQICWVHYADGLRCSQKLPCRRDRDSRGFHRVSAPFNGAMAELPNILMSPGTSQPSHVRSSAHVFRTDAGSSNARGQSATDGGCARHTMTE